MTPVTKVDASPVGAIWDGTASAEVTFPLGLPKEIAIRSKLFMDAGVVGPTDPSIPSSSVLSSMQPRVSIGTGLIWESPLGPVNIDVGIPVYRQKYDEIEIFRFNFGTRF